MKNHSKKETQLSKEEDELLEKLAMILFDMAEKELQDEAMSKSSKTLKTSKK